MVSLILELDAVPTPDDAADALAIAICTANREPRDRGHQRPGGGLGDLRPRGDRTDRPARAQSLRASRPRSARPRARPARRALLTPASDRIAL